jgi:hypothetical protein
MLMTAMLIIPGVFASAGRDGAALSEPVWLHDGPHKKTSTDAHKSLMGDARACFMSGFLEGKYFFRTRLPNNI